MGPSLSEPERVSIKAAAGCDFVTSQITFDPRPALRFLAKYQELCEKTRTKPLTVFISLCTVPTRSILSLIEALDVHVPPKVQKRLAIGGHMGEESINIAVEIFQEIMAQAKDGRIRVPLGLQIEQVGVNSGDLSLELLDSVHSMFQ